MADGKRRGYKFGVEWIAENDDPTVTNISSVAANISTLLLADLFGKEPVIVAMDIVSHREKYFDHDEDNNDI